jgi:tRNA-binding protein
MHLRHDPNAPAAPVISFDEFLRADIRVGTIIEVDEFPEAKRPALKLTIDFGSVIGRKRSSAQIIANYRREDLVGKQVAAVVNFPSRQIGPFRSEVLTLGFPDTDGKVVLFSPDRIVPNGGRLF